MNKGSFKQFIKGNTSHRFPKMVTLAVTSCVLVAMIAIDASASGYGQGGSTLNITNATSNQLLSTPNITNAASSQLLDWSQFQVRAFADRWQPRYSATRMDLLKLKSPPIKKPPVTTTTTTTANPAPTTTTAATNPAPTTTTDPPPPTTTTDPPPPTTTTTDPPPPTTGTLDSSEPSGEAPMSPGALSGYSQSYVNDFNGTTLPAGWDVYTGTPGGDPGGQWGSAHVSVGGGLLTLSTYQDSSYNNEWVAGGLCQCGRTQTYGAYFVRSRVTGAGPTNVELLWPTVGWPPEIDFNETGGTTTSTSATNIWAVSGSSRSQSQVKLDINMTQWHTWGVTWTPTSITYTVDGRVWGSFTVASAIPDQPMTLDLQQQTWCSSGWACPTSQQSMQIDWVAEYSAN